MLETPPPPANPDDFIFDNQRLAQCHALDFDIAEISCPAKYFPEASRRRDAVLEPVSRRRQAVHRGHQL
ncbi:MAG: hypothetical protein LBC18_05390 [Opitutaceae bacterium]|nr:hypothetical protein [Opitutaceae bacterium]